MANATEPWRCGQCGLEAERQGRACPGCGALCPALRLVVIGVQLLLAVVGGFVALTGTMGLVMSPTDRDLLLAAVALAMVAFGSLLLYVAARLTPAAAGHSRTTAARARQAFGRQRRGR